MRGRGRRKRPADDGWEERGGYMNAKMQKLAEQNMADSVDSHIFRGITIYVNGYTKPTSEELKTMVTKNGGVYTHYYSKSKVTHIIASNLPTSKVNHLRNEKVVSPQWIIESLQVGKLLPFQKYLLYTNKSLQQNSIITSFKTNSMLRDDFEETMTGTHSNPKDVPSASSKINNQNLVSEFYNRSRLHHISMWGMESKAYVACLQRQQSEQGSAQSFKGFEKLVREVQTSTETFTLRSGQKVYAHIDIDCFFVSVGLLKRPDLIGRPVAVTHSKGRDPQSSLGNLGEVAGINSRSDIASCSYEARKMGVSNGMHFGDAKKVCPNLVAIPYDFEDYKRVSQLFYDTILSYTLEVEAVSCDELYIDCTDLLRQTGASPLQLASALRRDIKEATGCNSSCGLGSNMLIARLSTKKAKPNGQHHVEVGGEVEFMKDFEVSDLPGIGHVMTNRLSTMGVKTCRDLSKISMTDLQKIFGSKVGSRLYKQVRGEDDRTLSIEAERKSVSAEINYAIRFTQKKEADDFIKELSKEVQSRLQQVNKKGKHLTLKIKVRQEGAPVETYKFLGHGMCDNLSKSCMLLTVTDNADLIGRECCNLLAQMKLPVEDLRGIGIQVSCLEGSHGPAGPQRTSNSILKYTTAAPKGSDQPGAAVGGDRQTPKHISIKEQVTTAASNQEHELTVNDVDSKFFLSLSQVDMETLKELPEDIQKEINEALKRKSDRRDNKLGNIHCAQQDSRPGCSHWNDEERIVVNRNDDDDIPLPAGGSAGGDGGKNQAPFRVENMEGLNESFLKAMPEDIRLELLNAHKQQTTLKPHAMHKTSPAKKEPKSDLHKNKRGRPKGASKNKAVKAAPKPNALQKNQQILKLSAINKESNVVSDQATMEQEVNLKGLMDIYEIKDLVRCWFLHPDPISDHVESLMEFLLRLVQLSDIEKAFILVRFLQRMEHVGPLWKEEIQKIIATVQAAVKSIYGGKFKLLSSL